MLGFSDEVKKDKDGNIISSNYPEIKLGMFMAQDAFIYCYRNKKTHQEPYTKINTIFSENNNDISSI
jgi:hypothetical protein